MRQFIHACYFSTFLVCACLMNRRGVLSGLIIVGVILTVIHNETHGLVHLHFYVQNSPNESDPWNG